MLQQNWNKITASSDGNRLENLFSALDLSLILWVICVSYWFFMIKLKSGELIIRCEKSILCQLVALFSFVWHWHHSFSMFLNVTQCVVKSNCYFFPRNCVPICTMPVQWPTFLSKEILCNISCLSKAGTHPCTGCFLAGPCKDTQTHTHTETHI